MPNEPTRPGKPGKHRGAHKAPTAFATFRAHAHTTLRTKARMPAVPRPSLQLPAQAAGLRRHAGTFAALGGVVAAGLAVSGSALDGAATGSAATERAAAETSQAPRVSGAELNSNRSEAALDQTSRDAIRTQIEELRPSDEDRSELGGGGVSTAEEQMPTDPREIALSMLPEYGWDSSQFSCLDELWIGESDWEVDATNPTSGAYGIPQSLPAEKMASAGSDWRTNPATQIEWGLEYISLSYGTPCSANEFKNANNWY